MHEADKAAGESQIASKLAEMSRHTSLTSLEAAIRLMQDDDGATAARRIVAVADHVSAATEALGESAALARRSAASHRTRQRAVS
jgi:CHASE3 domain sensor protein